MTGLSPRRVALLFAIPVVLIAGAGFATATLERDSALHSSRQQSAGQRLLTAMLDEETGARGYFETRKPSFLAPWYQGRKDFTQALAQAQSLTTNDEALQDLLSQQAQRSAMWDADISAQIALLRTSGRPPTVAAAQFDKSTMDDFRQLNSVFMTEVSSRQSSALTRATWLAVGITAAISIVLVLAGIGLIRRAALLDARRASRQQELRDLLQVSVSEDESHQLLIRHVEQLVPASGVAVFNRNSSDDRLEPQFGPAALQTPLRELGTDPLKPRSCMAVRLSRSYSTRADEDPLARCEACGKIGADVLCEPLLVGGQVIGSVLVARQGRIARTDQALVHESVVQAAPILANQRTLALAERRAASDALTGLPNRRAADEALKRMSAHAGRTISNLSVALVDLDHFKQVNDLHGHDLGDKALAAVGQILSGELRASDFAARYGGEEFLLLLPDTDRSGAVEVAEKLRRAIERADIRGIGTLTASFGVATMPEDAVEPEHLVRKADRALYAAKAHGRNRVEIAETAGRLEPPVE